MLKATILRTFKNFQKEMIYRQIVAKATYLELNPMISLDRILFKSFKSFHLKEIQEL